MNSFGNMVRLLLAQVLAAAFATARHPSDVAGAISWIPSRPITVPTKSR